MKKIILQITAFALILVFCMPFFVSCSGGSKFVLPTRTVTDDAEKTYGGYKYKLYDDGCALITAYTGTETVINIPESMEGHTVCGIAENVFTDNTSIVSVKFNKSLESIGDYAFYGCSALTDVTFNDKLWSVGLASFDETPWYASLTDEFVIVGDGILLKYLGESNDIVIPEKVKHLSYAFAMNYDIVSVEMGPDVLTIGSGAFAYCTALRRIVIGENVVFLGEGAFDGCESMTSVNIPDKVEVISSYAFNYCTGLTNVKIGKSVKKIERYSFCYCMRLKSVTFSQSVTTIEAYAFSDCYSLYLVEYGGSEEQFKALNVDGTNQYLSDAKKIFKGTEADK